VAHPVSYPPGFLTSPIFGVYSVSLAGVRRIEVVHARPNPPSVPPADHL
jgi:hypothetical protein